MGGFPDGALFDVVGTNHAVLRGYPDDAFVGRRFVDANVEYRFPLAHPQRGYRLLPVFVRHLHGTVFADAGNAWSEGWSWADLKPSAGAALGLRPHDRTRLAADVHRRRGARLRGEGRDARLLPGRASPFG